MKRRHLNMKRLGYATAWVALAWACAVNARTAYVLSFYSDAKTGITDAVAFFVALWAIWRIGLLK